ncbi:MAG TPA: sigma-70 family RNA polymerase sigma factor [Acidobacteriaceae bacterium]|nr:sigma-70 family RNA polymerase sigma factor [Acidobacteriaceae bacterium]
MSDTALHQLLNQRKQFLAFVQRRVSDSALAEDILQTAYLRAFERQDDFKPDESAVGWFYRLLRNAVIDNYRRQESRNRALETWKHELETAVQLPPELESEVCACLGSVVDGLKSEYADILRAIDLGEQSSQDFARQHNLSASNAGVRLHRARAALRKQLVQACGSCAVHGCLDCSCRARNG